MAHKIRYRQVLHLEELLFSCCCDDDCFAVQVAAGARSTSRRLEDGRETLAPRPSVGYMSVDAPSVVPNLHASNFDAVSVSTDHVVVPPDAFVCAASLVAAGDAVDAMKPDAPSVVPDASNFAAVSVVAEATDELSYLIDGPGVTVASSSRIAAPWAAAPPSPLRDGGGACDVHACDVHTQLVPADVSMPQHVDSSMSEDLPADGVSFSGVANASSGREAASSRPLLLSEIPHVVTSITTSILHSVSADSERLLALFERLQAVVEELKSTFSALEHRLYDIEHKICKHSSPSATTVDSSKVVPGLLDFLLRMPSFRMKKYHFLQPVNTQQDVSNIDLSQLIPRPHMKNYKFNFPGSGLEVSLADLMLLMPRPRMKRYKFTLPSSGTRVCLKQYKFASTGGSGLSCGVSQLLSLPRTGMKKYCFRLSGDHHLSSASGTRHVQVNALSHPCFACDVDVLDSQCTFCGSYVHLDLCSRCRESFGIQRDPDVCFRCMNDFSVPVHALQSIESHLHVDKSSHGDGFLSPGVELPPGSCSVHGGLREASSCSNGFRV
jgi:hypothetical protein